MGGGVEGDKTTYTDGEMYFAVTFDVVLIFVIFCEPIFVRFTAGVLFKIYYTYALFCRC